MLYVISLIVINFIQAYQPVENETLSEHTGSQINQSIRLLILCYNNKLGIMSLSAH